VARYVRILVDPYKGRVGELTDEWKENWFNKMRGFSDGVQVKGFPNKDSFGAFLATSVEEISEKEYFTEKLRGR